jgi:hypothetical protein
MISEIEYVEWLPVEDGAKQEKLLTERYRKSWRALTEIDLLYTFPIGSLRGNLMSSSFRHSYRFTARNIPLPYSQ